MGTGVGSHGGDVNQFRFIGRWEEDLVNHMDDAVAGGDIGRGDVGVVDHDRSVGDGEGGVVAVDHRGDHTIGYTSGINGPRDNVVEENVREGIVFCVGVEG